jgi:AMMECR1 domain-containing protein
MNVYRHTITHLNVGRYVKPIQYKIHSHLVLPSVAPAHVMTHQHYQQHIYSAYEVEGCTIDLKVMVMGHSVFLP